MSVNTTPPNKPQPLDYNVQIPAVFKDQNNPFDPDSDEYETYGLYNDVPLYDNFDERESYSLQEVLDNFAKFTALILKIATAMRKSHFEPDTCKTLLDCYYGCDWADWDIYPSQNDSYYFVLTTPELRGVEVALEMLQSPDYWHMDITEVRHKVDHLKSQLWQSLPDFYTGHGDPMLQPLSYDLGQPYPYAYIAENIVTARRPVSRLFLQPDESEALEQYFPSVASEQESAIIITPLDKWAGALIQSSAGISTSIDLATVWSPQLNILDFVADTISNHDPSYMYIDPEGTYTHFLTRSVGKRELVGLVISHGLDFDSEDEVFSGVFSRRQLAGELLKICEDKEAYFYDLDPDFENQIALRLKKLKAIM